VKYLSWIRKSFFDGQKDLAEEEKLRFMLAAYNAGPTRVQRATAKARELGLDLKVWFRNVELAMLELGFSLWLAENASTRDYRVVDKQGLV